MKQELIRAIMNIHLLSATSSTRRNWNRKELNWKKESIRLKIFGFQKLGLERI